MKVDKIILKRDEIDKINNFVQYKLKIELETLLSNKEIALPEVEIDLEHKRFVYSYANDQLDYSELDKNGQKKWVDRVYLDDFGKHQFRPVVFGDTLIQATKEGKYDLVKQIANQRTQIGVLFYVVQWYLKSLPSVFVKSEEKIWIRNTDKSDKKHPYVHKLINHYKIHTEELNSVLNGSKTYHCLCWGVRGHWRLNPRTGERNIWVRSYKKGKGRLDNEIETKEYRV